MAEHKQEIQIFKGKITFNKNVLYANGTKKRFTGFILIMDEHGNQSSYKLNSFRSQVTIQGDVLGDNGMKGMTCLVHGVFKENNWQGNTTLE